MWRNAAVVLTLLLGIAPAGATLAAWSFEVHRHVAARAIELLPDEMRPFYERHRGFIVEHAIDPDLWRSAGWADEPARHFLDLDAYGPPPFEALPRDRDAAVAKYGRETIERYGTLPWRADEMYRALVTAFQAEGKGGLRYTADNVAFFSAILCHYVADAHVPLHAVMNHDGQLTGQLGIHARFEEDLFARYRDAMHIDPARPSPRADPVALVFEALASGVPLASRVLDADRNALAAGADYDGRYYDRFYRAAGPIAERRISASATAVAAVWSGAWIAAGRPRFHAESQTTGRPDRPS